MMSAKEYSTYTLQALLGLVWGDNMMQNTLDIMGVDQSGWAVAVEEHLQQLAAVLNTL